MNSQPFQQLVALWLVGLAFAALQLVSAAAEGPAATPIAPVTGESASANAAEPADAARRFQAHAQKSAAAYAFHADSADGRDLELVADPVLRWANPLGGRKAHGDVFVWTDAGRPAAVLSLYEYTQPDGVVREHHEFCSLATGPLVGDGPGNRDWSPAAAGIELALVPDAPAPAESRPRRLSQMRELASRFTGAKITREEQEKRDLRLLSKPLIRYESRQHEVIDGALFALVEATDPEILLVIEAHGSDDKSQWHYGLARMNSLWLAASHQDRQLWEADVLKWGEVINRTDQTYMIFGVK